MNRLRHYFPNYILSVILVFCIIGITAVSLISGCILSPSFYTSALKKNNVYQRVYDYTEDYFDKSFAVSGIPAEIYMNAFDSNDVQKAVDGKVISLLNYIKGKTDKIEDTEIDFSKLETSLKDFFNEFAQENNVEVNDEFTRQLENTIDSAKKDINTFTNVLMINYIEKTGILEKVQKVIPYVSYALYGLCGISAVIVLVMVLINKKNIKNILYWISTSGICASVIMLVPCYIIKSSDYFSRLIMRTDYIYYAVTGILNNAVDTFMTMQIVILAVSLLIMIVYLITSAIAKKHEE